MKKRKIPFIPLVVIVVAVLIGFVAIKLLPGTSYSQAYENTKKLKNYTMGISTIVTLNDGEDTKQTYIDQVVKVNNKGKDNMVYRVETTATTTDENGGVVTEESSYTYKNGNNYHSFPGVNYMMPTTKDLALETIRGLENVILVPYDKMVNVEEEKGVYTFEINPEDASDHIKAMMNFATGQFEDVNFFNDGLQVTATVEGKYITDRSFYLSYDTGEGQSFAIEVYAGITERKAEIEEIDESKFSKVVAE